MIKNKISFFWGLIVLVLCLGHLAYYFSTGCFDVLRVGLKCGEDAHAYVIYHALLMALAIFMLISSFYPSKKNSEDKKESFKE